MSVDVLREVFHHSQTKGTDRCIMVALADAAHHDGVTWLPIEPTRDRPNDPRCICVRANCSKREAIRGIQEAVRLGELDVRKAQRGQRRISVYRVVLGAMQDVDVEYDRLPFELDEPFGRGDNLAPRSPVENPGEMAADVTPRGDGLAPHGVTASNARGKTGTSLKASEEASAAGAAASSDVAAAALLEGLTRIGVGLRWRTAALEDVPRAEAWLELALAAADTNPAGYWRAGFESGETPSPRERKAAHGETRYRWILDTSWQLESEDAHAIVDSWGDLDDVERSRLHELVDQANDEKERARRLEREADAA